MYQQLFKIITENLNAIPLVSIIGTVVNIIGIYNIVNFTVTCNSYLFFLTQLNKHPQIFSYLTKITEDNAEKQYTIATRMHRFLKLSILLIFSLIILFTYLTAIGVTSGLGFWFLPLAEGLLLIPTAIGLIKSLARKKKLP